MYKRLLLLFVIALSLCSCGINGKRFKIKGHILNINQGEFYVYDDMGLINGIDTIKVEGGRFTYEMDCERPTTVMLVFPNFSEQPIFAEPGKDASVKGDASHLKELRIEGTKTNETMTKFRSQISNEAPPEIKKHAERFVEDHPESPIGAYLVKKYFIANPQPDYRKAYKLIETMLAKQPTNTKLAQLAKDIKNMNSASVNSKLPIFTSFDMNGRPVASSDLSVGVAVICTWASWSYDSMDQLRAIQRSRKKAKGRLKVLSIAIEASKVDCKKALQNDSVTWPNICDGAMFDGKIIRQLGMLSVPDNILVKDGRIIGRSLSSKELEEKIDQNL